MRSKCMGGVWQKRARRSQPPRPRSAAAVGGQVGAGAGLWARPDASSKQQAASARAWQLGP